MLVFWKENLVLLSIPKTGSTALEGALAPRASLVLREPPEIKHAPCYRYKRFLKPLFKQVGDNDPELMAIVRNPIDWLGSWYRYRTRDDLIGHPNSTRDVSFDDFVLEYCKGSPPPRLPMSGHRRGFSRSTTARSEQSIFSSMNNGIRSLPIWKSGWM